MICQRCGNVMYYAPLGQRWYHHDLNTLCPVSWPAFRFSYSTTTSSRTSPIRVVIGKGEQ